MSDKGIYHSTKTAEHPKPSRRLHPGEEALELPWVENNESI